ncbi:TerB family tellurite resistance protein [Arenibacter sp. BSSL-BM3]|uniref:TerB family tellurite resistance protein n=1 Tax=Arenibacter arenosicollis TaxID=2762274 RepID=A0ABR7QP88_9FLAO|nr:TerB family tellurite resistance protein [Arenibacter arenosicollis]MBC8769012.1 TerB family tellurite resistance protein [Arenibacter arenosicollis]
MSTYLEKLGILSQMISFAKVDKEIKDSEYQFLLGVANQLEVDKETFDSLFDKKVEKVVLKSEAERILQFHRLVLLMNVDHEQRLVEIEQLHNIGLKFGLPQAAIEQVLTVMHHYPDKVVPPAVLINIFKAYNN